MKAAGALSSPSVTHVGIQRQPDGAEPNLPLGRRRRRVILDAEIRLLGLSHRAGSQNHALG
jgi:hypothetical protein